MKKKPTKKNKILRIETFNWNKTPKKDQDKALRFMLKTLYELSECRKFGYDPKYWAEF